MHNKPRREQQPCGQRELPPYGERERQPCGDFADRLVDLSDGELAPAEAAIVREHCEECLACRLTLVRLDRSLAVLEQAIVASESVASPSVKQTAEPLVKQPVSRPAGSHWAATRRGWTVAITASAAAAALLLAGLWLNRNPGGWVTGSWGTGEVGGPQVVHAPESNAAAPEEPIRSGENPERNRPEQISPEMIARRLALIEQVARLEASLAMTPDDPWFAAQRANNQRLLAGFRQAVEELDSTANPSERNLPIRDEVL